MTLALRSILVVAGITLCFFAGLWFGPVAQKQYYALFPEPDFVQGDYTKIHAMSGKPVTLFTTSTCPFCKSARDLLDRNKVDYRDFVIDTSPEAKELYETIDSRGRVPLIFVGDRKLTGFREQAIIDAIHAANLSH